MVEIYDIIIVGGGPGGYSAALYCARAGLNTLVLEKISPGGQMATSELVDNYPGFDEGVNGFDLAEKMKRGAERFGAVSRFAEATALELGANPKLVRTTDGDFEARAVIVATGASPRKLGLPEEDALRGRGVAYCATCDGRYFKDKVVAVAGGGNSAAADALFLSKLCKKVYVIHRRDTLRASSSYLEPLQKAENIEFVWNAEITALRRERLLTGLEIKDKISEKTFDIECSGLFVAIGRAPDTALVRGQLTLNEQGYIAADETTRTNIPGVFAVGDVRAKSLRQIVTAAADGAVSSEFAAEYIRSITTKHKGEHVMKKYVCTVCGYVYDEAEGIPDAGIAPGTKWEDLPDDWTCPLCGVPKSEFEEQ